MCELIKHHTCSQINEYKLYEEIIKYFAELWIKHRFKYELSITSGVSICNKMKEKVIFTIIHLFSYIQNIVILHFVTMLNQNIYYTHK